MSEPLENEIEEELRRKQLKALWDKFGLYPVSYTHLRAHETR